MMPVTHVTCGPVTARIAGQILPVERSIPGSKQAFTPSGASQQSSITAQATEFWHVTTDTAVWLKFSANPTASAGNDHFLPAGSSRSFSAAGDNEKVAVIAA